MGEESERRVVQASEILGKIERGEDVEYDGVIIEGDLDISGLELPTEHVDRTEEEKQLGLLDVLKVISSKVTITNSEIKGAVNFNNACLQKSIAFDGTEFGGIANFGESKFGGYAKFVGSKFTGGHANFWKTEFGGIANFGKTRFGGDVNFEEAKFGETAYFGEAKFDVDAYFWEAKFDRNANFVGAKFCWYVDFKGAKFGGDTSFVEAEFTGGIVDFKGAKFGGDTSFVEAEFTDGIADFGATKFGGDAYFNKATFGDAKFGRDADFRKAEFTGRIVDFRETKFGGDADFEHDQFIKDVLFDDAKFDKPVSQEVAYRIAKRKMENQGNKKAADDYFYKEMEAIRIHNGIQGTKRMVWPWNMQMVEWIKLVWSKIWRLVIYGILEYIFIQGIFGYGVRPMRLFGVWILMVFAFASCYSYCDAVEGASAWFDYIWFSIATSATPGYALYSPIGHYKIVTGVQAIIGTFMWAAFIATFARKWQR